MPRRFTGTVPRPQSRRFRVSVPEADESVLAWIGAQSDLSVSVRSLIREAIERHGYRDATCYPVQQQPRRGRPPKSTEQAEQLETIDGHPIPEQIAALEPDREPEQELLMVPVSHEDVTDEPDESAGFDEAVNPLNDMEDMLGALR
jgi:hypothetical protein